MPDLPRATLEAAVEAGAYAVSEVYGAGSRCEKAARAVIEVVLPVLLAGEPIPEGLNYDDSFLHPRCGCPDRYSSCPLHAPGSPYFGISLEDESEDLESGASPGMDPVSALETYAEHAADYLKPGLNAAVAALKERATVSTLETETDSPWLTPTEIRLLMASVEEDRDKVAESAYEKLRIQLYGE